MRKIFAFMAITIFMIFSSVTVNAESAAVEMAKIRQVHNRTLANTAMVVLQLVRLNPPKGFVFVEYEKGEYEVFNLFSEKSSNRTAILRRIKENKAVATFTVDEKAYDKLIEMWINADEERYENCRYVTVPVKPAIALNLRETDTGELIDFKICSGEDKERWQELVKEFTIKADTSGGKLVFDWRLIYQAPLAKLNSDSDIHQMLEYLEGKSSAEEIIGNLNY